jgi:hypothetical protein
MLNKKNMVKMGPFQKEIWVWSEMVKDIAFFIFHLIWDCDVCFSEILGF